MNNIRTWLKPETRGTVYTVAAAAVAALVMFGFISATLASSVAGLILAIITLIYAIIHSESTIRTAIYAVCAASAALFVGLGNMTDAESNSLLAIVAPVLGITLAAAKTPSKKENEEVDTWVTHSV